MNRPLGAAGAALAAALVAASVAGASTAGAGHSVGRQSRASGVGVAGGNVYVHSEQRAPDHGGGCTLSFAVRDRATHRPGVLTAGHCVGMLPGGPAYAVYQTRNGQGNTTDPGLRLGQIEAGDSRFGRHGDSARITLDVGRRVRAEVFTGGAHSHAAIPVVGRTRLRSGMRVCYSGAVSGEHCGFRVVGGPSTVPFRDHGHTYRVHHEWRARRHTCTSRPGDSGSPVYVKHHGKAEAVGILSGGQRKPGRCPFFFTPVKLALHQLDLTLLRS